MFKTEIIKNQGLFYFSGTKRSFDRKGSDQQPSHIQITESDLGDIVVQKSSSTNLNRKFKLKENRRKKLRSSTNHGKTYPKAPHNTTQFLTANRLSEETPKTVTHIMQGDCKFTADEFDEICLTGGTMKGTCGLKNSAAYLQYLGSFDSESSTEVSEKDYFFYQRDTFNLEYSQLDFLQLNTMDFNQSGKDGS